MTMKDGAEGGYNYDAVMLGGDGRDLDDRTNKDEIRVGDSTDSMIR